MGECVPWVYMPQPSLKVISTEFGSLKTLFRMEITILSLLLYNTIYVQFLCAVMITVRGGPFDMEGGGWLGFFLQEQTFFSTPSLNLQFFSDLIKSKQFFSQQSNSNQFCSPFISFDSSHTMLSSRGVITFTWTFHHVF